LIGDIAGLQLFHTQPAKAAAIEAHWDTNPDTEGAEWNIIAWPDKASQNNTWALSIPHGLSLIVNHSLVGKVVGLKDFVPADQPPAIPLIFYTFRVMIGLGFAMTGLALVSAIVWWRRRKIADDSILPVWLLKCWVVAIPMGYIATECGWVVREVGRQPWAVYGLLRTEHAVSHLPATAVATSLVLFVAIYTLLLGLFLLFARRIFMNGPDINQQLPMYAPISNTNTLLENKD